MFPVAKSLEHAYDRGGFFEWLADLDGRLRFWTGGQEGIDQNGRKDSIRCRNRRRWLIDSFASCYFVDEDTSTLDQKRPALGGFVLEFWELNGWWHFVSNDSIL
jgi:hypothetical protein